jgi:hypothetical protein
VLRMMVTLNATHDVTICVTLRIWCHHLKSWSYRVVVMALNSDGCSVAESNFWYYSKTYEGPK